MDGKFCAFSATWPDTSRSPSLSVIVPAFNTEAYLRQALDSLLPADPTALEVIVVHDGGSDGSCALAAAWVRAAPVAACLIDQPNRGLSCARMAGLAVARGRHVGFLDSDDRADPAVLLAMAQLADDRGCDVVLCRSVVLDDASQETTPFYDAPIWDLLLRGQRFRRVTLEQEPRLLRLEPNANPRILRRAFCEASGFGFPPGLLFEDLAPHVQSLAAAAQVGLYDATGYWYRIGRWGKITDERSERRFDAIRSVELAIDAAAGLPEAARANLAVQAVRLLFWCAGRVTNGTRTRFVVAAVAAVQRLGLPVLRRARIDYTIDSRERLLMGAFATGAQRVLCDLASGRRPALLPALRLALHREGRAAAKLALRRMGRLGRRLAA